jgi:hypothetical protein
MVGEAPTLSGIQTLRKDAYSKANVNENLYDTGLANITTQKEELKSKGKDEAIGEFLMNLGFGAAGGTSQNALTNFSQAAGPAGKGLIGSLSKLKDKEEKLNEREFAMMDAQNKFRQTGADADLRNMQEETKDYRNAKREYAKADAGLQDSYVGRVFSLETNKANEAGQNARAVLAEKVQRDQLSISAFDADTRRMVANKPELLNTIITNLEADPAYVSATGSAKNKMITDAVSEAKSTSSENDNTLRAQAGKAVADSLTFGPIANTYKKLMAEDATGAKAKAYRDKLVLEELQRLKQSVSGSPAGVLQYDPTSGTIS